MTAARAAAADRAAPAPRRGRWRRAATWTGGTLAALALLAVIGIGALLWALRDPSGSAWLLARVPQLKVTAPRGSLLGDFAADRVEVELPGSGTLVLERPSWKALGASRGSDGRWLHIVIDTLHADRAEWRPAPRVAPSAAAAPPASLRLPLEIEIGRASIDELLVGGQTIRAVGGRLHLGADRGARHAFDALTATIERATLGGALAIGADPPFAVAGRIEGASRGATPPWTASARADGPLAALRVAVAASVPASRSVAVPASGAAAGSASGPAAVSASAAAVPASGSTARTNGKPTAAALEATAEVRPFAPWPLGELRATFSALDIAAFVDGAPATSLSGSAVATTSGASTPASLSIVAANARAGRWNEGLLPVREWRAELGARPDDPSIVDVRSFGAELGSARVAAGRVSAQGRWTAERWNVDADLVAVRPRELDARAPQTSASGRVSLVGTGFAAAAPSAWAIALNARLAAQLLDPALPRAAPRQATVDLDARATAHSFDVAKAQAALGEARATIAGRAARADARAPWRIDGRLQLRRFDPAPWWPGAPGGLLARGPSRLDGEARIDLLLPAEGTSSAGSTSTTRSAAPSAATTSTPTNVATQAATNAATNAPSALDAAFAYAAAARGSATVTIADSVLAGVPIDGEASWRNDDGRAAATVRATAGGNRVDAQGRLAPLGSSRDEWHVALDAPRLDALAPLVGGGNALAGSLAGTVDLAGRWPALDTSGTLQASGLRVADVALRQGDARWRAGTSLQSAIDGRVTLRGLVVGGRAIEGVEAQVGGSGRAHRAELRIVSAALPPEWVDRLALRDGASSPTRDVAAPSAAASAAVRGATTTAADASAAAREATTTAAAEARREATGARSVVTLVAEGGLVDVGGQTGGWRGRLNELAARSLEPPIRQWLLARDVRGEVGWGDGRLRVTLEPGSAQALGATLRWSRVAWIGGGGGGGEGDAPGRLDAQAQVDALAVAPVLRALQPDFGWSGDLSVGARLEVRSAPGVHVDVVVDRRGGDLAVSDELGTQALGLTDLRVAVAADDGVWRFSAGVAGRTLGVASAAVTARTSSRASWPEAQAPIDGVAEVRIDSLGTWGRWVPAGWRLGGELHATAQIGGRFGAPEYVGRVEGRHLAVRNFVQGVNVTDGEVQIALVGSTARIERFTAKAGDGTVRIDGTATFADAPAADLRLTASRFEVLGRVDRRIAASGQANVRLDAKTLRLNGDFKVDEGLIDFTRADAPTLGDDVVVVRRPASAPSPQAALTRANAPPGGASPATSPPGGTSPATSPPRGVPPATSPAVGASPAASPAPAAATAAPPAGRDVALDLRVAMGEKLRVRGRGLDAGLRGELHITSPGSRMAVNGTLSAVDGTYQAYGQKLRIDRGVLAFVGPVENPRLDIEATRPDIDVRVGVAVTGTVLAPRVRLFADSDMSDLDKLSWLVLGRASETTGGADTALLQQAALALLSGEGPGVTDRLIKSIGLDEVSFRQSAGAVKDTIVSLGKQISKRWYVGYERGLNTTTGTWQLIYRVAQRVTVRAEAGSDNAIDVNWTLRWK